MKLKDLPVEPNTSGSTYINKVYMEERDTIETEEDLVKFIDRWKAIWYLNFDEEMEQEELDIVNGNYNKTETLNCLKKLRQSDTCEHIDNDIKCTGLCISLPRAFLFATMASMQFEVSIDIALIQCNGGFEDLKEW